jgi:hypothetical protein
MQNIIQHRKPRTTVWKDKQQIILFPGSPQRMLDSDSCTVTQDLALFYSLLAQEVTSS